MVGGGTFRMKYGQERCHLELTSTRTFRGETEKDSEGDLRLAILWVEEGRRWNIIGFSYSLGELK